MEKCISLQKGDEHEKAISPNQFFHGGGEIDKEEFLSQIIQKWFNFLGVVEIAIWQCPGSQGDC